MTQNKKRTEPEAQPAAAASRSAASKAPPKSTPKTPAAKGASAVAKAPPPAPAAAPSAARGSSFEAILKHIIRLAEGVALEKTSAGAPVDADAASDRPATESAADRLLARALDELAPDTALKLRTLMIAGREGRGVTAVHVDTKPADADAVAAAAELRKNGILLADYLRRGHALACATGFDLERNISAWPSSAPHTLDERAWLSFGVQLAKSQPDDWTCLGFVGADPQLLTKLYLRLGDHAWWSFRSLLDRPSAALVDKEKRSLTSRRSKGVTTASLKPMADRSCGTEGRALLRAVKAIRARVGATEA